MTSIAAVYCADSLLHPCPRTDIQCLSQATEQFLENTHRGIKEYDIKPIDPIVISNLIHEAEKDMGLWFYFKNITVSGLKNQKISDFQMDIEKKSVVLKTKADINIVGDFAVEFRKQSKVFSGVYSAVASVIGSASYGYNLKKDAEGIEHFEIGPETITCEVISEPKVTLNEKLLETLRNDTIAMKYLPKYTENRDSIQKEAICVITKLAYVDVVHNIRASAKILPKTAFFTDM